jgi:ribosomal protein S4
MRRRPEFKIYSYRFFLLQQIPSKIRRYKHKKWKYIKKNLKAFLSFSRLKNYSKKLIKYKGTKKLKYIKKNKQTTSRQFRQLYDQAIKPRYLTLLKHGRRSKRSYLSLFKLIFLTLEYRLDIFLWKLNFVSSIYTARKLIILKDILVNNISVSSNYELKEGDIIEFKNKKFFLKGFYKKKLQPSKYHNFVELDAYTSSIIILKGAKDLNLADIGFLIPKIGKWTLLI